MAFTEIVHGLDWQDISFLNELVGAWQERWDAMGLSAAYKPALFAAGDDIQTIGGAWNWYTCDTCFRHMQLWLDWCTEYDDLWVNHEETITGSSDIPVFDLESFRDVAGLHADGWRRATSWDPATDDWTDLEDAMWSRDGNGFGEMEAADIIGPWILDDLQKAFDALRWRLKLVNHGGSAQWNAFTNVYYRECDGIDSGGDCAAALAAALADWSANSWQSGAGSCPNPTIPAGPSGRSAYYDGGSFYRFSSLRWKGQAYVSSIPLVSGLTYDWVAYLKLYGGGIWPTWNDYDGTGMAQNAYSQLDSGAGASASSITSSIVFGADDTCPLSKSPSLGCPVGSNVVEGIFSGDVGWVIKWGFTHTL